MVCWIRWFQKKVRYIFFWIVYFHRETVCGTYEYMAPEILNKKPQTIKIDTWSLGVLLYELIHGMAPYPGKSMIEVKKRVRN